MSTLHIESVGFSTCPRRVKFGATNKAHIPNCPGLACLRILQPLCDFYLSVCHRKAPGYSSWFVNYFRNKYEFSPHLIDLVRRHSACTSYIPSRIMSYRFANLLLDCIMSLRYRVNLLNWLFYNVEAHYSFIIYWFGNRRPGPRVSRQLEGDSSQLFLLF